MNANSSIGLLQADKLCKSYRGRTVVDGLSLSLEAGQIVGLLGPNGAGKTTTFHMLVGLVRPSSGRVLLDGRDITHLPMHLRARAGLGFLSQEPSIFRGLSVLDNLRLVLELQGFHGRQAISQAEAILEEFDLRHLADQPAASCSGGERRRLEVARTMACRPRFLLLDEPFSGIDPIALQDIRRQIMRLAEKGLGMLITDHNIAEALSICQRALVISGGRLVVEGTPGEIVQHSQARAEFLGVEFTLS